MVCCIEDIVPLANGESEPGLEAARHTAGYVRQLLVPEGVPVSASSGTPIRYEVMSSASENWIPLIPVNLPEDNHECQLQRAEMTRIVPASAAPKTKIRQPKSLLREGHRRVRCRDRSATCAPDWL